MGFAGQRCTRLEGRTAREETPLPRGPFNGTLVYDLTYGDRETPLLREAREAGCLTLDGLPMLIAQAERQFEWWTGQRPRPGIMKAAAQKRIGRDSRVNEPLRHGATEIFHAGRPGPSGPGDGADDNDIRHSRNSGRHSAGHSCGLQEKRRGPADTRLGVSEDRGASDTRSFSSR